MTRPRRAFRAALTALLVSASVASAQTVQTVTVYQEEKVIEPDGAMIAADLLVARPLGLATTIVGCAMLVVGLPFAALAGDVETPARILVGEPARFTFQRPLGAIDL